MIVPPMLQRLFNEMRAESDERRREHEAWVAAPLPRYFHSCRRHIRRMGTVNGYAVRRCPCGGIEFDGFWMEKNAARRCL